MKAFKTLNISLSAAIATIGLTALPLLAVPNNGGSVTMMDDLQKKGYHCQPLQGPELICLRDGGPNYLCRPDGTCLPIDHKTLPPRRIPPIFQQLPNLDRAPIFQ
jgi:hypothetical protein